MRWLRWISGIVWIFCWYTLYLEVFRWHHMTKSLPLSSPAPSSRNERSTQSGHTPHRGVRGFSRFSPGLHDSHDRDTGLRPAWATAPGCGLGERS